MPIRTILSPGIEIREIDRSQTNPSIIGSTSLVMGFANKGQSYSIVQPNSITDLINNFGEPTNEAERYFHYGARQVLENGGTCIAVKIPYDNKKDNYVPYVGIDFATTADAVSSVLTGYTTSTATLSALSVTTSSISSIVSAAVTSGEDTTSDYNIFLGNNGVTSGTAFRVYNERRGNLTGSKETGGVFVAFVDYLDAVKAQRLLDVNTDKNDVLTSLTTSSSSIYATENGTTTISSGFFVDNLSGSLNVQSVSRSIASYYPAVEFVSNGASVSTKYRNHVGIIVCKSIPDVNYEGRLVISILEAFVGSLFAGSIDSHTGVSDNICDIVNSNSNYIKILPPTGTSNKFGYGLNPTTPFDKTNTKQIYTINGSNAKLLEYAKAESAPIIKTADLSSNMSKVFERLSDILEYQIDLVADCGLTTIAQQVVSGIYDPEYDVKGLVTSSSDTSSWRATSTSLITFCQNTRKDCMVILDTPRQINLQGAQKRIRKTKPDDSFSNTIATQLRYVTGLNSSYAALYDNWRKLFDSYSGKNFWVPPSVHALGVYVRTDRIGEIWDAPAGLNRGGLTGIADLAYQPKQSDSDLIYPKSINYAKLYPNGGFILEGQKTTQVVASAFDRVNVRRLFLRLERYVYQTLQRFLYEPNNAYTRSKVRAAIDPIFSKIKAQGGMYDYKIVCDESNNTDEVIDANELKIAIFIKPVRTIEFILVDMIATRTGGSFTELT